MTCRKPPVALPVNQGHVRSSWTGRPSAVKYSTCPSCAGGGGGGGGVIQASRQRAQPLWDYHTYFRKHKRHASLNVTLSTARHKHYAPTCHGRAAAQATLECKHSAQAPSSVPRQWQQYVPVPLTTSYANSVFHVALSSSITTCTTFRARFCRLCGVRQWLHALRGLLLAMSATAEAPRRLSCCRYLSLSLHSSCTPPSRSRPCASGSSCRSAPSVQSTPTRWQWCVMSQSDLRDLIAAHV